MCLHLDWNSFAWSCPLSSWRWRWTVTTWQRMEFGVSSNCGWRCSKGVESAISLPYVRILSDTHSHANTGQIGILYDYSRKLGTPYPDLEPGDKLWNHADRVAATRILIKIVLLSFSASLMGSTSAILVFCNLFMRSFFSSKTLQKWWNIGRRLLYI